MTRHQDKILEYLYEKHVAKDKSEPQELEVMCKKLKLTPAEMHTALIGKLGDGMADYVQYDGTDGTGMVTLTKNGFIYGNNNFNDSRIVF